MRGRDVLALDLVDTNPSIHETSADTSAAWDQWAAYADVALFEDLPEPGRPKCFLYVTVSVAIQAILVGLWVLHSVTADVPLPEPQVVKTFITLAPTPMTTPPPARPAKLAAAAAEPRAPRPTVLPRPMLTSIALTAPPVELDFDEIDLGVPEAIDGSVPGGVIGGLVGGLNEPAPAPAPAVRLDPIRIAGTLDPPAKLVHVDPIYPDIAAHAHVEGLVILEATIDGSGKVKDLRILKSVPLLDEAATAAVRQWEYAPTVIGGNPVPILMTVTVSFALA